MSIAGILLCLGAYLALPGPTALAQQGELPELRYVGSSTVGLFLRDAEPVYGRVRFVIDTAPESAGGERAILEASTDLAGIARAPQPETLRAGIVATAIGRDGIAVIVNSRIPVTNLTLGQLSRIFTGRVRSWREVGGPDLPVRPHIVGSSSATRDVFRAAVLGAADYVGCETVEPDAKMLQLVAATDGAIGQISFSFLDDTEGVRAVSVDGEDPTTTNFDYPISRSLYLLWREENEQARDFAQWARDHEGQRVVMRRFVGFRVVGSVRSKPTRPETGTLLVYTETSAVLDGGIFYYPHRSYEILTREGQLIRRVVNHRGRNDENPTAIHLLPGTYLIRAESQRRKAVEFFATVDVGETTRVYVEELLGEKEE